jgi:hypothetical protein
VARIEEFFRTTLTSRPHPTKVECGWQPVRDSGQVYLQLSTYGSDDRQSEKKVSQTIQLDRARAAELLTIIRETFPDL